MKTTEQNTDKEIQDALAGELELPMEEIQEGIESPLNDPVIDRSQEHQTNATTQSQETEPLDAPTQQFQGQEVETPTHEAEPEIDPKIAKESAKLLADSVLGSVNMVIGVGGGYFVKIKKDEDFYQFEEVVELIDEQNDKNVERIKLDKEDIALLKPLLVEVLKSKVQHITPEKQLLGAVFAILIKKYQAVQEIKADNDLLYSKIVNIVRLENNSIQATETTPVETEEEPQVEDFINDAVQEVENETNAEEVENDDETVIDEEEITE